MKQRDRDFEDDMSEKASVVPQAPTDKNNKQKLFYSPLKHKA